LGAGPIRRGLEASASGVAKRPLSAQSGHADTLNSSSIVNLKTAKMLGIDMPTSILLRADEVIE
jgi:hypothetical protein